MKVIKFILVGGYIGSSPTRENYIPATRLMYLYKLNPMECFVYTKDPRLPEKHQLIEFDSVCKKYPDAKILYPRDDGNYII
jgi:hypothetical protein